MVTYGIAFIIGAVVLLITAIITMEQFKAFEKESEICQATITDTRSEIVKTNDTKQRIYRLLISYEVDGVVYSKELPSTRDDIVDAAGKTMPIRFKRSDPDCIKPGDGSKDRKIIIVMFCLAAALVIAGVVMILL